MQDLKEEITHLHAELCSAVAEPSRIQIVYELSNGPRNVSSLAKVLGLSPSAASRHLKVLREKNFVKAERNGHSVIYSLAAPQLIEALNLFLEILNDQLAHQANLIQNGKAL